MITSFVRLIGMTAPLVPLLALPARADGELGFSRDGVHWSQSVTNPLFDESMRWVLEDSETAAFYIRNQGGTAGNLTVDLLGSVARNLIDSGDPRVKATGGNGSWTTVSEGGAHRLLSAPNIPNGKVVPINVNEAFDFSSPNATQNRASDFNFRATLSKSTVLSPSGVSVAEDEETGSSGLPGTGALELLWYALLGAMQMGVGLAFMNRRRDHGGEAASV